METINALDLFSAALEPPTNREIIIPLASILFLNIEEGLLKIIVKEAV